MRQTALLVLICLVCTSSVFGQRAARPAKKVFNDEDVQKAMQSATDYLWSQQKPDGSWPTYRESKGAEGETSKEPWKVGPTALVVYALLESGVSPQDPRLMKALDWMAVQPTDRTYELALRANAFLVAMGQDGKYFEPLRKDVAMLVGSAPDGAYDYASPGNIQPRNRGGGKGGWSWRRIDNSNSQYGLLGVWAGARAGLEIPGAYWQAAMNHWKNAQKPDGGWTYIPEREASETMTTAGVASSFICFDYINNAQFANCGVNPVFAPIENGLKWIDEHSARLIRADGYLLYGIERVGLASGYKYFGTVDWYKEGIRVALSEQTSDGSWDGKHTPMVETAYILLFLARGQHPVLFNQLQYDGYWRNRPRALANLTRWISRTFERTVNWQIINLQAPVEEWHDAPILYISGHQPPKFSDEDIEKLKTFVLQGGTILSVEEGRGAGFTKTMTEVYAKILPDHKLEVLPKDHPVHTAQFELRRAAPVQAISNGIRLMVIHVPADLPRSWQLDLFITQPWDFQQAFNIFFYCTDGASLRNRGTSMWPKADNSVKSTGTVKLARLKHGGQFDPEPLAWERFAILLSNQTGKKLQVGEAVAITDLKSANYPVAHLTGTAGLELSALEKTALKEYCSGGGTLILEAAGGNTEFRKSAEALISELWGPESRRPLATTSDVYNLDGLKVEQVSYRRTTRARLGNRKEPRLQAVTVDNRIVCLYSAEDLTAGLVGYQFFNVDGYAPDAKLEKDSAYQIMRNAVLWAAEKNKK